VPYKSEKQRRKFFVMEERGEIKKGTAERWAKHTRNIKDLPARMQVMKKMRKKHD